MALLNLPQYFCNYYQVSRKYSESFAEPILEVFNNKVILTATKRKLKKQVITMQPMEAVIANMRHNNTIILTTSSMMIIRYNF